MKIFITEEEFNGFLPNILPTVGGEVRLLDKLNTYISDAEKLVIREFTGEEMFDEICALPIEDPLHGTLARLVLSFALHTAIPAINLVLTPNGFATVGTQTLVAASRARIDALMNSLLEIRDDAIADLLPRLRNNPFWCGGDRGTYYRITLFPDFRAEYALGIPKGQRWEKWKELRPQIREIEDQIAEAYISPALMMQLRAEMLMNDWDSLHDTVAEKIRNIICVKLTTGKADHRSLADVVNLIRQHPEEFPFWHESQTAQLYTPPVFRNEKKSSGYFF